MTIFKAPLAYETKNAVFQGHGAYGMPALQEDEEIRRETLRPSRRRRGYMVDSVKLLVPPVSLPSLYPPLPPHFDEDVGQLKKSLFQLEQELCRLRTEPKRHGDGLLEQWRKMKAEKERFTPQDSAIMKHYSSNALKETSAIHSRIKTIKAMRIKEEEEQRTIALQAAKKLQETKEKALREAANKAAVPLKAHPPSKPVEMKPPVEAPAPQEKKLEVTEADIGSYEQDPEDYEKPSTYNRAKGIIEEAQKVLASAERIKASTDPKIKARRMELRMEINRRVGQVSNAGQQVLLVIKELLTLSNAVWSQDGQEMLDYCAYTMATKFIEQAETQICSHTPSAFPYGQTVADLIGTLPSFKNVLMALLFERCPYIIPRYPPRLPGQSEESYRKSLGYKEGETDTKYFERMSGLVSMYAAMIQSIPLRLNVTNPYDIKFAWLWLASIMNMRPRPVTPFIIIAFLDIAGYRMATVLGKSFLDLMQFTLNTFIPMIPSVSVSPKTRLKIFVEDVLDKEGKIDPPEGFYIDGLNYKLVDSVHRRPSGSTDTPRAPHQPPPAVNPRPASSSSYVDSPPKPRGPTPGRPVFSPMNPKGKKGGKNKY